MSTKNALKAINDLVKQQKFDEVIREATSFLEKNPQNYSALIFLAFAQDKQNNADESEVTYLKASLARPGDIEAWRGLIKLYERLGAKKLRAYKEAVLRLANIFQQKEDAQRCQETIEKYIDYARVHGDKAHYVEALGLLTPESPAYPLLEGRISRPGKTYEEMAAITETEEKKRINTMIGERRTRIGARLADVTVEAKREVYENSQLEHIYRQLINWTNEDDIRRTYEEKLLQYCYDRLLVAPSGARKEQHFKIVSELAEGMVIIKHQFRLAWDIVVNWKDYKEICEWDVNVLREYCLFFPESDLAKVITGFLTSQICPFPKPSPEEPEAEPKGDEESEDDEDGGAPTLAIPLTDEDRLLMMAEGMATANSLLAYRLMGEYYQHAEEHESSTELIRKAMKYLEGEKQKTGIQFQNTEDVFSLYLGTALVFYQSPRNHQEAKSLFDNVLKHDASCTAALIGVGLIYEEEEDYDEAIAFLERARARDGTNLRVRTEAAWVKALKGDYEAGRDELEECVPLLEEKGAPSKELLAQTQYRLGWCVWNVDTSRAARKSRTGAYAHFLAALKNNLNLAPAYTGLGLYYADYARDAKRARRCFQKAVELSPAEVEAAERLARSFADAGDWDRVELVAQRVVDSGRVKPPPGSKRKGVGWPFAALGVSELNKQDFHRAIVSFQAALRVAPEDYHSWVGLGESYYSSGRYIAATKAILYAQGLEEQKGVEALGDVVWFTRYLLANIRRELAEFDDAVALYREVIETRPTEQGVALALMQTMVESAFYNIEKGVFGKAVALALDTITFAAEAKADVVGAFNFWKAVGEACSIFSIVQSRATEFPADLIKIVLEKGSAGGYETFSDVDRVSTGVIFAQGLFPDDEELGVDLTRCIHASILCHKRGIHVSSHDIHAQAVAHYNLGWAEHRAHLCLPPALKKKSSRYLKAAVRCFKRAIELEAGNADFWNALGVVTCHINPAVSQHAFVRSLYIDERSPVAWTNLGALALLQNDLELAREAFTKAQSNDPDYAHGWLGQGFIALVTGDRKEARGLFTHAMTISESSSSIIRQQYAVSVFDHVLTGPPNLSVASLIQPIFALGQVQALRPQDLEYGHLATLFQERTGEGARAVALLEKICAEAEADFEVTESPRALVCFALAKTDLARSYLAAGRYGEAVECAETALGLSSDEADNELTLDERRRARLSAHLTAGLAQYHSGEVAEAVGYFEAALGESDDDPDAVCLLAQMLWATGEAASRERARTELFGVVARRPDHVQSVLLLGVIALLDDDDESLDAVVTELQALRTAEAVADGERARIGTVLRAVAALGAQPDGPRSFDGARAQAQTDAMLHPYLPHGWAALAEAARAEDGLEAEGEYAAGMALAVARREVPPRGSLGAAELAGAYAGTGRPADAQTAIVLAPWKSCGWEALADAVEALRG